MAQQALAARLLSFCLLIVTAVGVSSRVPLSRAAHKHAHSFVRSLELKQVLRVCNAYPFTSSLDVFLGSTKLTEAPLSYKTCAEFSPELQVDDKIDFKVGEASAGTFTISELPNSDAVLLMVIYRHDTVSTAVSFESHVFASLASAQIAVLDTYKGAAKSELRIEDTAKDTKKEEQGEEQKFPPEVRSELLRFDSVVAVDPGEYQVALKTDEAEPKTVATSDLVAVQREAYVVIRCGVEAEEGTSYPQELIVYPHTDKKELGAASRSFGSPALLTVMAALSVAAALRA